MDNKFIAGLSEADMMAQQYFKNGSESVKYGEKRGADAVENYYEKVYDLVSSESEEVEFIFHISDFMAKVSLQEAKNRKRLLTAGEFSNFVSNEKSLSLIEVYINENTGSKRKVFIKRKNELITMFQNELCEHKAKEVGGCYIATAVYGSYNCPQVWTLRRFRDNCLAKNLLGNIFIRTYYASSPILVKWFGKKKWFNLFGKWALNNIVKELNEKGYDDSPYTDIE